MGGIYYRPFSISNLYKIHKIILYHYGKRMLPPKIYDNRRGESTLKKLSSKQLTTWLCINYSIFILAFFTLGFLGENKTILIINFVLNVIICIVSLLLNIVLLNKRYKTPFFAKVCLLLITLCLAAFTYFAFLMPENGLPPVLFA